MNEKAVETYYETLKKVCDIDKDEITYNIIDARPCSKNGYRLLVENDYGERVFEYVDGSNYKSAKPKNNILVNYDGDNDVTEDIFSSFGFGTIDADDLKILADSLDNCEDWDYQEGDDIKSAVIENVSPQTSFMDSEISYLFDKYMLLNPKDRLMMDTVSWIQKEIS